MSYPNGMKHCTCKNPGLDANNPDICPTCHRPHKRTKLLRISSCDKCPYFDDEYRTWSETCTFALRAVPDVEIDGIYYNPIPSWCPLSEGENNVL